MDELKLLIEMVAGLPALAVWVLVGFLAYKITIIGSVYGVARLLITKAHHAVTQPRVTQFKLGDIAISEGVAAELRAQLQRMASTSYIHDSDVKWLREQLDKRRP